MNLFRLMVFIILVAIGLIFLIRAIVRIISIKKLNKGSENYAHQAEIMEWNVYLWKNKKKEMIEYQKYVKSWGYSLFLFFISLGLLIEGVLVSYYYDDYNLNYINSTIFIAINLLNMFFNKKWYRSLDNLYKNSQYDGGDEINLLLNKKHDQVRLRYILMQNYWTALIFICLALLVI